MSWNDIHLTSDTLALAIPIVAILVGGIIAIAAMIIKHRERIAMIERGIHPDYPPEEGGPAEDPAAEPPAFEQAQPCEPKRFVTHP
jgi:hypothetical protein